MAKKLPSLEDILKGEEFSEEEAEQLPTTSNVGFTHLPVAILVNTSAAMSNNNAIERIKDAVDGFISNVANPKDEFYRKLNRQGDFCVLRYGDIVETVLDWTAGQRLPARSNLEVLAHGSAPMGEAIVQSADRLLRRYRGYKITRTRAFCGLVFNLTCGVPTDMDPNGSVSQQEMWRLARDRVQLFENMGSAKNPYAQYVHFGMDPVSLEFLKTFAGERPLFMPTNGEEVRMCVNSLEGVDPFGVFVRFIEMSLNSIMSGDG